MTVLGRKRAFTACAAMLAMAAAFVAALSPSPRKDGPRWVAEPRPVVLGSADTRNTTSPHRRFASAHTPQLSGRSSLSAARQSAREFVRAFLRYQQGNVSAHTRATLAQTASAAVEHDLDVAPARAVGDAPHPELRSMRLYARSRTEAKASVLLRYGRKRSLFEFLLERGAGGWRVMELYP